MISFDLETTGVDPESNQIVSGAVVYVDEEGLFRSKEYLLKTDIESSPSAVEKHGITKEYSQENGTDYKKTVLEIYKQISEAEYVITANGAFGMTFLDSVLNQVDPDGDYDLSTVKMIDIMVIDKYLDKYRRGSRKLEDLCDHYGIDLEGVPHNAKFDALVTFAIYVKQEEMLKEAGFTVEETPSLCELEYDSQRRDLAQYFEKIGKKATIALGYPVNTDSITV